MGNGDMGYWQKARPDQECTKKPSGGAIDDGENSEMLTSGYGLAVACVSSQ